MNITITKASAKDSNFVNELLREVLWKPFGFTKNIKSEFKLEGKEITLIAKNLNESVGVIVANEIDNSQYKICVDEKTDMISKKVSFFLLKYFSCRKRSNKRICLLII